MMISDFHNDFLTSCNPFELLKEYNESKKNVVAAIFRADRRFEDVLILVEKFKEFQGVCRIAFEDIGYGDINVCRDIARLKPVYVTLTWNGENMFGYGCKGCGRLKQAGFDAIKLFNKYKIPIDTAHINQEGFFDIINSADRVVNSHTCFKDLHVHPRNIDSKQINLIVEKKGLIGLALYSPFLSSEENLDVDDVYRHIDYFVQKFGYQNLCIGSDFYGAERFPKGLDCYGGFEIIQECLYKKGYKKEVSDGILCNNLKRFLQTT